MSERSLERRIVTVLFCDVVGFTSLSEALDAEDVVAVQDAYFAAVRETVTRHGGALEKFIGDAAVAVFGVPRVRDDDAVRAVRAALAVAAAVDQLGARLGLAEDKLRLRVGVNTGEVVYGEATAERGPVTGDTVNVAARLQTAAPPGGVARGRTDRARGRGRDRARARRRTGAQGQGGADEGVARAGRGAGAVARAGDARDPRADARS